MTNQLLSKTRKFIRSSLNGRGAAKASKQDRYFKDYILYELADLKKKTRFLIAENEHYKKLMHETRESFNYQWDALQEGEHLLTNETFMGSVKDTVCTYAQLPAEWFKGKKVLDAGCGNGRFSFALASLGAKVTSFDISVNGTANLQKICDNNNLSIKIYNQNLLEPLRDELEDEYDLVWSYGVLHHTGDTYKSFENICNLTKIGGYMFLMLYGEPRSGHDEDIFELYSYERLRRATMNKTFEEKIKVLEKDDVVTDVHGWFDAISPHINDLYTFQEIESWLIAKGYFDIKKTIESRNLHIISKRK